MRPLTRRGAILGGAASGLWMAGAGGAETASGLLDGRDFEGILGPAGEGGGRRIADSLHFRDGFYWSRGCIACSFAPGPYFTRAVDGGIAFTGVLESPERGIFRYMGLVRETGLVADIDWRRERWYWTFERGFRFEGAPAEMPAADLDAAFDRAGAPRDPACTI